LLSHRSAAALWGLMRPRGGPVEVSAPAGRVRRGIAIHEGAIFKQDRAEVDRIPVTSVAHTLFDLAEVVDEKQLAQAFEEADRLHLLELSALDAVCARGHGRRALRPIRRLMDTAQMPDDTQSPLEDRVLDLCRKYEIPTPVTGATVLGREVDALWPAKKLMIEADSWGFHGHREAFERDRARDAAMQAEGYRVIRLTHRRMESEPEVIADEIRRLLGQGGDVPQVRGPYGYLTRGTSRGASAEVSVAKGERGQGTVEWVGLVALVSLMIVALVAAGVRVPGTGLARAVASRILCAAALADGCGDEPVLIATYGTEVGKLVRRHMPTILFEQGSRAMPVDFRRCRSSACGDGSARGLVHKTDADLPVTAFVHVVDCTEGGGHGTPVPSGGEASTGPPDCSGSRAGSLYLQYWLYYADSATLRGVPIAGDEGFHEDDWESVQIRIGPDGSVDERASSHHGYNYAQSLANAGSDAGIDPLRDLAEDVGARPRNGWGKETRLLVVSGGSHAGNTNGFLRIDRVTPGRRVHLVPLEPIAEMEGSGYQFAITPPWRKQVWRDPEAAGTD
jgi:Protein of unknown function (DUF559)